MFLTILVPVLGEILAIVLLFNLGKKFYKNGILTVFFPYVMIPIIAFDKNSEYSMLAKAVIEEKEEKAASVSGKKTDSEKAYGRKKFFITLLMNGMKNAI